MAVLTLRDVGYAYGKNPPTLFNINMDFEFGKMYSLRGKSGAGKTTLLSLIAGLDVCTSGEILYKGTNLNTLNRDLYRVKNVGIIFQGYNLINNMSAVDNVVLSCRISHVKGNLRQKAFELLHELGIDKKTAVRKVLKLSGGEQQRVAIARALSHEPDIIIADEPTSNLDRDNEDEILKIMRNIASEYKKCVIIATHSDYVSSKTDETYTLEVTKC